MQIYTGVGCSYKPETEFEDGSGAQDDRSLEKKHELVPDPAIAAAPGLELKK
jgi:hypothetical protein